MNLPTYKCPRDGWCVSECPHRSGKLQHVRLHEVIANEPEVQDGTPAADAATPDLAHAATTNSR